MRIFVYNKIHLADCLDPTTDFLSKKEGRTKILFSFDGWQRTDHIQTKARSILLKQTGFRCMESGRSCTVPVDPKKLSIPHTRGRSKTSVASARAFPYDPHLPAATRNPIRATRPGLIQVSIAAHTKFACPYDPTKGSMERCVLMTTGRKHSPNDHKIPWSHRSFLPLLFWMFPPENTKQQMHPATILFLPGHGSNLMKMQTWRSAMNEKISCRKKHYGRSLHGSPILPVKTGNRNLIFAFCIMEV